MIEDKDVFYMKIYEFEMALGCLNQHFQTEISQQLLLRLLSDICCHTTGLRAHNSETTIVRKMSHWTKSPFAR